MPLRSFAGVRWLLSMIRSHGAELSLGTAWVFILFFVVSMGAIVLSYNPGDSDFVSDLQLLLEILRPKTESTIMIA